MNALAPWLREPLHRALDALAGERLAHALLVCGPMHIGKRAFGDALAQAMLCRERVDGAACGHCRSCGLFAARTPVDPALTRLVGSLVHPHGLSRRDFDSLFTTSKPVIFNFHSYASLVHKLTYSHTDHDNLHVHGCHEKGNINTPLELAITAQNAEYVAVLLDSGADANARIEKNETPLHTAARFGSGAIAQMLLGKGARRDAVDDFSRTPLDTARSRGNMNVARVLES